MKYKLPVLIVLFFFCQITVAQDLNIKFLEQISGLSFWGIDEVMEDGYGFTRIDKRDDNRTRQYVKGNPDDLKTALFIKILNTASVINTLDVMAGENYNIKSFKSDLLSEGYLYKGSNEYDFLVYKKDEIGLLLGKEANEKGFIQIVLTSN